MKQALADISPREREILARYYLLEQSREEICCDMELSENQFRSLKSRVKLSFQSLLLGGQPELT
jgi:DNA-directed RNA polymerase specialized sigma24 family protein